jgi:hypothetical protein
MFDAGAVTSDSTDSGTFCGTLTSCVGAENPEGRITMAAEVLQVFNLNTKLFCKKQQKNFGTPASLNRASREHRCRAE